MFEMLLLFVIVIKWPAMYYCSLLTLSDLLDKGLVDIEIFNLYWINYLNNHLII